ncbi:MAG: extracellular solute-binding protein [Phototrophicaceae bacterium]
MFNRMLVLVFVVVLAFAVVVPATAQTTCTPEAPCQLEAWIAFSDHRLDWAVDAANQFNALYPQYNVTITSVANYDTIVNNYTLAREEGNYPQIVQLFDAALQFAVDSGWFVFAEDVVAGREDVLGQPVNFDDIIPAISNYYTVDGKWASVAWNTSTPIGYYNMDLLAEVGIMEAPRTWGDILAACEALQPLVEAGTISACASWPFTGWFIEQWNAQHGEFMVNNENGRAERATASTFNNPASKAIAEFYREMYSNGYFIYEGLEQWGPTTQNFGIGKVALHISSSADARNVVELANTTGFTLQTAPMPYNEDFGWNGNILGGATMYISEGLEAEIQDGAMAFLLFFSNTENAASWHTASGYVPVRNSAIDLLSNLEEGNLLGWDIPSKSRVDLAAGNYYEVNPNFLTAYTQLSESPVTNATLGGKYGTFQQARPIYLGAVENYMLNGGDLDVILQEAQDAITAQLEEYNLLYAE